MRREHEECGGAEQRLSQCAIGDFESGFVAFL